MAVNGHQEILNECCCAATTNVGAIPIRWPISSNRSLSLHQVAACSAICDLRERDDGQHHA